jgi:hypothetical protein
VQGRDDDTRIVSIQKGDAEALVTPYLFERIETQDGVLVETLETESPELLEGIEKLLNF